MKLTTPFSNKQVNQAGVVLANIKPTPDKELLWKIGEALLMIAVVDSWRATHIYPLRSVTTILRRNVKIFDPAATVSRRLKRMEAIIAKLQRYPTMQLTTMQDIGGCRAIVESIEQVNALKEYYKSKAETGVEGLREYDYIKNPKEDGYRSSHLVVRFKSNRSNAPNRRIEIQIRTRLQHQWATAVETVDFFTKQTIKLGGGHAKWKRFFALVGSIFAAKESCSLVPNTPNTLVGIVQETFDLWHELKVLSLLRSWSEAMIMMDYPQPNTLPPNSMCLVELDVSARTTTINPFRPDQLQEAQASYAAKEKEIGDDPNRSAVLVSVDSLADLKEAYPSYYGDTEAFLKAVAFVLSLKGKALV
jgi:hypothetical protein